MVKLAVYDFCSTVVNFETADEFIHYVMRKSNNPKMFVIDGIRRLLQKLKILTVLERIVNNGNIKSLNKAICLRELKGLSKKEIDDYALKYYVDVIRPNLIPIIIKNIIKQVKEGFKVVIVSASYYPFLIFFCQEYGIDLLVTNEFEYDTDEIFTGKICRKDCIGEMKVNYLKEALPNLDSKQYDIIYTYGDSLSDIPILSIGTEGFVISYKKHKSWIDNTTFKEIIYE